MRRIEAKVESDNPQNAAQRVTRRDMMYKITLIHVPCTFQLELTYSYVFSGQTDAQQSTHVHFSLQLFHDQLVTLVSSSYQGSGRNNRKK